MLAWLLALSALSPQAIQHPLERSALGHWHLHTPSQGLLGKLGCFPLG